MPRKKITTSFEIDEKPVKVRKMKFEQRTGKVIKNEIMYLTPKMTDVVGIVMANEDVLIMDMLYDQKLAYIKTNVTNRIGYIDSKSVL